MRIFGNRVETTAEYTIIGHCFSIVATVLDENNYLRVLVHGHHGDKEEGYPFERNDFDEISTKARKHVFHGRYCRETCECKLDIFEKRFDVPRGYRTSSE